MRLSSFITQNLEGILVEWEAFARTQGPSATHMSSLALRDHAKLILTTIAAEIETAQTPAQQKEKSRGMAPDGRGPESAAATHGTLRQLSGFSLIQLTAEFRALRATVLRLWLPKVEAITETSTSDMVRFNEAIDQALAESIVTYSRRAAAARDTFLAILGHDLRSPLATVAMAGTYLASAPPDADKIREIGEKVQRGAASMTSMVNDLLEYARVQLDGEIPIVAKPMDLMEICQPALENARAVHPNCPFEFSATGDLRAPFDRHRMQQVLSNLLNNAAQYRDDSAAVKMTASGEADAVVVTVQNHGPLIPPEARQAIFDPMVRLAGDDGGNGRSLRSIGLGLFIAREITEGHGGTLEVQSDAGRGTVFTVRVPRRTS
ncbi:HAMP domain-containing sensor histidine kinase [Pseudoduganella sp. LjRoot289]|uniref:sensor histidine kinase n=1 Tax=Pseudoduganella sp. LjRoot289 TaxID=3342314 RepID=UPI003ED10A4E